VEHLHAKVSHEKQRNDTLKHELCDVSREYTEEATVIHSRQQQHDRYDAELSQTISRLKAELRESRSTTSCDESASNDLRSDEKDDLRQDQELVRRSFAATRKGQ
jgi:predicted  nucleic acid-binding Zn-ribbon protein